MRDDARRRFLDPTLTGQDTAAKGAGPAGPAAAGGAGSTGTGSTGPAGVIAVDAMGGDHGPAEIVAGAVAARRNGIPVVLTGRPGLLRPLLAAQNALADVPVIPADDVLTMSEGALASWRRPRSSIAVACQLVRRGQAAAVVSAGSTAGIVATARLRMHSVPGVSRPALAVLLPTRPSPTVLIDAGAIADPRPEMLVQFAQLGVAYTQLAHGIAEPRVGLLTIGAEPGKGNKLAKRAHELLAADPPHGGLPIGFIGNVEGTDLLTGKADVIVTDGFTGNVALKTLEGAAAFAAAGLRAAAGASPGGRGRPDRAGRPARPGPLRRRRAARPGGHGGDRARRRLRAEHHRGRRAGQQPGPGPDHREDQGADRALAGQPLPAAHLTAVRRRCPAPPLPYPFLAVINGLRELRRGPIGWGDGRSGGGPRSPGRGRAQ
jgi:glycerol-3-phosphate acyltransferase PlsX